METAVPAGWRELCEGVLEGRFVRLEPLRPEHAGELEGPFDPAIFRWFPRPYASAAELVRERLAAPALPWLIRHRDSGRAVGETEYLSLAPEHRRLEIGHTWIAPAHQGTQVNPEAKLLLLRHAFGALGCLRVEFKTDALNVQSQAALSRLGATREGTLRHHMSCAGGRQRDSVYFSVIAAEWPDLERRIVARLGEEPRRPPRA